MSKSFNFAKLIVSFLVWKISKIRAELARSRSAEMLFSVKRVKIITVVFISSFTKHDPTTWFIAIRFFCNGFYLLLHCFCRLFYVTRPTNYHVHRLDTVLVLINAKLTKYSCFGWYITPLKKMTIDFKPLVFMYLALIF